MDANILVAIINNEYPIAPDCMKVLSLSDHTLFRVHTSPICLAIAYYFAEKKSNSTKAKQILNDLNNHLLIAENTESHVKLSLDNKSITDFEDGLQYYAAKEAKCNAIITYNVADFHFSDIPIFTAKQYLVDAFAKKK